MTDQTFEWIEKHMSDDPVSLRLKFAGRTADGNDHAQAILQIECRRKFGRKLQATLEAFPRFWFPTVLSGEQASSDLTAEYHASLIPEGGSVVDLTSGLGIDALHMSRRAATVVAVDRNEELTRALRWNATGLRVDDVLEAVCADCRDFIDSCIAEGRHFDVAFIDPARRGSDGGRVFAPGDCSPDVTALMPSLSKICGMLVVKASPMLDISHTIGSVHPTPTTVMAIGTATECKELAFLIRFGSEEVAAGDTVIEAVTLGVGRPSNFAFTLKAENSASLPDGSVCAGAGDYVCEPYPAVMKAGGLRMLAKAYGLKGFHANTKLLWGKTLLEDFPGTQWRVLAVLPWASGVLKRFKRSYPAISVTSRNFGMSADELRRRLGVREASGDLRLFAVTDGAGQRVLLPAERRQSAECSS